MYLLPGLPPGSCPAYSYSSRYNGRNLVKLSAFAAGQGSLDQPPSVISGAHHFSNILLYIGECRQTGAFRLSKIACTRFI